MAKMTKAAVMDLMDEWKATQNKIDRASKARDKEMLPFTQKYQDDTASIVDKYDTKIAALSSTAGEIKAEILGYLETQDKDQIIRTASGVVAEQKTETKIGSRVIDVEKFLAAAKAKGAAMYECINVLISKAEKLLGKTEVDKISEKKETVTVSRTLRLD